MSFAFPASVASRLNSHHLTIIGPKSRIRSHPSPQAGVIKRIHRFDQLDFDAFSNPDWKLFEEIHCPDVVVSFTDGHDTHGIKKHIEDMKAMFVATLDLRITSHLVSFEPLHTELCKCQGRRWPQVPPSRDFM